MSLMLAGAAAWTRPVGGGGDGDPYWDSVVMLLRFNGNLDNEAGGTITPGLGVAAYAPGVFGQGLVPHIAFTSGDIHTGDFTVEFFVKGLASQAGRRVIFSYTQAGAITNFAGLGLMWQDGQLVFYDRAGGGSSVANRPLGGAPAGDHFHVSISIKTSEMLAWVHVNGVEKYAGGCNPLSENLSNIGFGGWANGYNWLNEIPTCVLDEMRITQGVARNTSDFTPPVGPYPAYEE